MTQRRSRPRSGLPADTAPSKQAAPAAPIELPTHWSAEQALAVFEILDELRDRVWAFYGRQIQQALRDERCDSMPTLSSGDDGDVPF